MPTLFDPIRIGDIELPNRIVMAPLTRDRAGPGQVPTDLMAEYYRQRAGAGLIVSEATQILPEAQGYLDTPGIHSDAQAAGWRKVTDAVHAAGGRMFLQLWHVGRISHVSLLPGGAVPVSSSARRANSKTFIAAGFAAVSEPRALRTDEIPEVVAAYGRAAQRAVHDAGFDGVEVHAANGYLIEQFLRDSVNDRGDAYGGPIEHRARFLLDVVRAVCDEVGAGRTGLRLSPISPANDIGQDSDPQALFNHVADRLSPLGLAYVHVVEGATGGPRDLSAQGLTFDYDELRRRFDAPWMVNNGYDRTLAFDVMARGGADLVAFGKPYIGNPDLVERLRVGAPFTVANQKTFYGGGAEGYTDYPTLEQQAGTERTA